MAESFRPVLNPVLRFTKDARPESVTGGGKSAAGIRSERLSGQRSKLAQTFREMAATAENRPRFGGRAVMYAEMFDDSLAPSWTPRDLFASEHGTKLIVPFRSGYLVEIETIKLKRLATHVETADRVDISRVKSARFFDDEDVCGAFSLDEAWTLAPNVNGGRAFMMWMMPLRSDNSAEHLLERVIALRDELMIKMQPLLASIADIPDAPASLRRSLVRIVEDDRVNAALRSYRRSRRAVTTIVVPDRRRLGQLVASGAVYKLTPSKEISSTSPGVGKEPNRPLPADLSGMPVVGMVDGGLTASSYKPGEAWRAPAFVDDAYADAHHGNQVASLIAQGHDWNNQLSLPQL